MGKKNPFNKVISSLKTSHGAFKFYSLKSLGDALKVDISRHPFSIKILIENVLRHCDGNLVTEDDVRAIASWNAKKPAESEIPFLPARVMLQDFTGVPCVADLAAMRSAVHKMDGDTKRINPIVPVDLVIDHSVQVDYFGSPGAFEANVEREFERNRERYVFLRWAQKAFDKFRVVPPGTGIVHQVNLEYLAKVVQSDGLNGDTVLFPDTLVGTDSHTTMINGLGVLGWGVGGIEAEACMLGQPLYMPVPEVVGFKLTGELVEGATATDLVLIVTQILRQKGVVEKFVEFFGPGLSRLTLADRATVANMSPEYGATMGFFPVDGETLNYLRGTGRDNELVELVEHYTKSQGMFRTDDMPDPVYSEVLELDMRTVEPCLAGPRRPQDRVPLKEMKRSFGAVLKSYLTKEKKGAQATGADDKAELKMNGHKATLTHGSVVISAITSCTNTSNPSVMIGAGLLAKKAVERGLKVNPAVKTSLAPGSRVVTDYLKGSGLMPYLEALGFHLVGYGCTTCIGNSGPLPEQVADAVKKNDLTVASVLSGNRNFEGRINPLTKMSYLASPPLVVAYAIAGTVNIDMLNEPLGVGKAGKPVFLRDIWPSQDEVRRTIEKTLNPELFRTRYASVFEGDAEWKKLSTPHGNMYEWDPRSTYIQEPPFFKDLPLEPPGLQNIKRARVLALLGDSVTTDHISPAGDIPADGPAGGFLIERGVTKREFNSFGARRGNHEVMIRGTLANIRLKNLMVPGTEGGFTIHVPTNEKMSIYEASIRYKTEGIPLIIIAGKEYGSGSSRDWAAKGTMLLGVKAVIAESYERIHRSNLVGMGVLPLQFKPDENRETLNLTGFEEYGIEGVNGDLAPRKEVVVNAKRSDGSKIKFKAICRLDSLIEIEYYRNGGILQTVLRQMMRGS
ncbi:MAG: aconitate hydratase AcnA [Candidatus Dadabacteria bacterium]|nr:aconitate hydratase AcnA [Candidatus Dadabacteria bacterium]